MRKGRYQPGFGSTVNKPPRNKFNLKKDYKKDKVFNCPKCVYPLTSRAGCENCGYDAE